MHIDSLSFSILCLLINERKKCSFVKKRGGEERKEKKVKRKKVTFETKCIFQTFHEATPSI